MAYVACEIKDGTAYVADEDELSNLAWATPGELKPTCRKGSRRWSRTIWRLF